MHDLDERTRIAQAIKRTRYDLRLSQQAFADLIGVSRVSVSDWENLHKNGTRTLAWISIDPARTPEARDVVTNILRIAQTAQVTE